MADETRIKHLLVRWKELREQGSGVSARELCERDGCGELADELERRIQALQPLDRRLASTGAEAKPDNVHEQPTIYPSPRPSDGVPPEPVGPGQHPSSGEEPLRVPLAGTG